MTLNEFKAWLEGFETSFHGAPSEEQYAAIKDKLSNVKVLVPFATPAIQPYPNGLPSSLPKVWYGSSETEVMRGAFT